MGPVNDTVPIIIPAMPVAIDIVIIFWAPFFNPSIRSKIPFLTNLLLLFVL